MDVDAEMPEYHALASYYSAVGGTLWVAENDGAIVGMIAVRPLANGQWEICRVYVHPSRHGSGLGHELLDTAERFAVAAERFVLWSDTRFARAHRFYEKRSYVRAGPIRVLNDISSSLEYRFEKPRDGIELLDAAAAESAIPRLSAILIACVEEGAGVSFLPPLAPDVARAFWRDTARDVAGGRKLVLGGWVDGVLAGTVTLAFAWPENQPHRADVVKLLVDPAMRRHGLARRLMARLELEAVRAGRWLLTLDTRAEGGAEALYRSMGWNELGVIPCHALTKDGTFDDTVFFWKRAGTPSEASSGRGVGLDPVP
ncbi:MAG: GNAT family N-acetyltransferase [Acetobacteraceae bacterium]|nr:GNAT family N-acetyltransferase [Acetobacteraceae bacterium]